MKKLCKKIAIVSLAISLVIVSVLFTGCDSGLSKTDTALLVFKDVQYELYNAESLYNRCEEDEFPVSVGEINLDTYNPFTTFDLPREDFLTFSQTVNDYYYEMIEDGYMGIYDIVHYLDSNNKLKFDQYYRGSEYGLMKLIYTKDYIGYVSVIDYENGLMHECSLMKIYYKDNEAKRMELIDYAWYVDNDTVETPLIPVSPKYYGMSYSEVIFSTNSFKRCLDTMTHFYISYDNSHTVIEDESEINVYSELIGKMYTGEVNDKIKTFANDKINEIKNYDLSSNDVKTKEAIDVSIIADLFMY